MSQHDMSLADQSGASFRADLNNALGALVTNNSGATEPTDTFAYMWWADTTTGILKQRNSANNAWISVLTISTGKALLADKVTVADASADTTTWVLLGTSQTGDLSPATDAGITYNASTNVLTASATDLSGTPAFFAPITAALSSNVALSNTAQYFDGPVIAQGSTGKWYVSGSVYIQDISTAYFSIKLWDGTNIIASTTTPSISAGGSITIHLSGFISSPAGNLRISVRDHSTTGGYIYANASGLGKDSVITAFRVG